jgi:hypothetical protein
VTVKILFSNYCGETLNRDGQVGAADWFPESLNHMDLAKGEGTTDGGYVTYRGASGSITINWQVSGDGTVTMTSSPYASSCRFDSGNWVLVANRAPAPSVPVAPNCTVTVSDRDCLCQPCDSDRACMLAIIANRLSPEGTLLTLPGFKSNGDNSCCGETLHWLLQQWGSDANLWFMVDVPEKPGNGTMPSAGDIFALHPTGKPAERAHVGFIYRIRGGPDDFEWQAAEGGQEHIEVGAAGKMWINPNWRGIKGTKTELLGWKNLDTIPRVRTLCRGKVGKR